jgi:hypothetical protein
MMKLFRNQRLIEVRIDVLSGASKAITVGPSYIGNSIYWLAAGTNKRWITDDGTELNDELSKLACMWAIFASSEDSIVGWNNLGPIYYGEGIER